MIRQLLVNSKVKILDGIGTLDNRPSTNQLHHFVQLFKDFILFFYFLFKKKNILTYDRLHVTGDMSHMTRDTWHMTHDA